MRYHTIRTYGYLLPTKKIKNLFYFIELNLIKIEI